MVYLYRDALFPGYHQGRPLLVNSFVRVNGRLGHVEQGKLALVEH
jgi:hypothetical protein